MVSGSLNSPKGVLFTFRSPYYTLSVVKEYLALDDGPPSFTRGFTGLALLWYGINNGVGTISTTGLSPSMAVLSSTVRL